ncbi:MAG: helix-turn-helix transcriptional regulator, partial [Terracidiphilus sp.]
MMEKEKNLGDFIRRKLAANPQLAKAVDEERLYADIAEQIVQLRMEAKLTQKELAERADTRQSVISRIEDADYYGHSLKMLNRIAHAFDKRIVVIFCPAEAVHTIFDASMLSQEKPTTKLATVNSRGGDGMTPKNAIKWLRSWIVPPSSHHPNCSSRTKRPKGSG